MLKKLKNPIYETIFSENDIKRYEDFGRFFRSIAFYIRSNPERNIVERYNFRPREMINDVLSEIQKKIIKIEDEKVEAILTSVYFFVNT